MSPIPAWDEYPIYLEEDEEEEDLEFDIFDLDIDYEV